jgi:hypothetical protein
MTGTGSLGVPPLFAALAARNLYLDRLEDTTNTAQVYGRIEWFRHEIDHRPRRAYPH